MSISHHVVHMFILENCLGRKFLLIVRPGTVTIRPENRILLNNLVDRPVERPAENEPDSSSDDDQENTEFRNNSMFPSL